MMSFLKYPPEMYLAFFIMLVLSTAIYATDVGTLTPCNGEVTIKVFPANDGLNITDCIANGTFYNSRFFSCNCTNEFRINASANDSQQYDFTSKYYLEANKGEDAEMYDSYYGRQQTFSNIVLNMQKKDYKDIAGISLIVMGVIVIILALVVPVLLIINFLLGDPDKEEKE
jgi:hypothetical protein